MIPPGLVAYDGAWVHAFSIRDLGRCGIAWGDLGIVGVQLPEAREIDTRKRLFQLYPDARELRPPPNVEIAIEGIATLLRGGRERPLRRHARYDRHPRLQSARLCVRPQHPARRDPHLCRGRLRLARVGRRPFGGAGDCAQSLHDHRALPSRAARPAIMPTRSRRTAAPSPSAGCCRSRAPSRPPARPCSTCCFPLRRHGRTPKFSG